MKALILNFRSFPGRKDNTKDKLFLTFDMYDVEKKVLYNIFQDAGSTLTPNGVIPSKEECEKTFPRVAELETRIEQIAGQNGRPSFRFYVDAIKSWDFVDLNDLF